MAEHRGGVVHIGGWKDDRNRRGIELPKPRVKAFASLRRQTAFVDGKSRFEPMVAGDESAARRLARAAHRFGRKKLGERSFELCLRVGFSIRREKKPCLVGFAFISAGDRPA